jgi:hypothetical protein
MHIKNKRGQSTVEYILLVTAVIAVMVVLLTGKNNGVQGEMNSVVNTALDQIGTMGDRLTGGEAASPTNLVLNTAPVISFDITK